jgi:hypothetical protein
MQDRNGRRRFGFWTVAWIVLALVAGILVFERVLFLWDYLVDAGVLPPGL